MATDADQLQDARAIQERIEELEDLMRASTISAIDWTKLDAERKALEQQLAALKD